MKNVSWSKFLFCFRPVVLDMEHPLELGMKSSSSTPNLSVLDDNSIVESSSTSSGSCLISPSREKNFSRLIKAVFFETILSLQVRDRKSLQQDSNRSKQSSSSSSRMREPPPDANDQNQLVDKKRTRGPDIKPESACSSISTVGSLSSPSRSISAPELRLLVIPPCKTRTKNYQTTNDQTREAKPMREKENSGIYLLVIISLAVVVIWGKLCAILFTSIWLYFLPRRDVTASNCLRGLHVKGKLLERKESKEYYKKRVIMEGILERNHHHHQRPREQSRREGREING